MVPRCRIEETTMTSLKKLFAAALAVTVLATASIATSGDALAKSKHRGAKFGGNPMAAMMGGGNPMAMMAKNPMMMMMAMMMMQKMASGGMGGMPPMGPMSMFGAPPMGGMPFGGQ
jgi:D-tyrosyl-tRNA(Tyr) deacylase